MRHLPLLLLLLLAGACQKQSSAPQPQSEEQAGPVRTIPKRQAAAPQSEPNPSADEAVETLRRYYALIEAHRYGDAFRLRTSDRVDEDRFAANFKAYESYHAQLGAPSLPVTQGDFDYVEVPVMITGRFLGGKPFGSAGSVSLRRARTGADRGWRLYTR